MEAQPSTLGATDLWNDIGDGTAFFNAQPDCDVIADGKILDFPASAVTDLQNNLSVDWWGFGVKYTSEVRSGAVSHWSLYRDDDMNLEVTYTNIPTQLEISINVGNVGNVANVTANVNITQGLPSPVNITSVLFIVNGTTQNTNNTEFSATAPHDVDYGPYWFEMTTDNIYNFTISAVATNDTGTVTNSSSSLISREYDPSFFPAQVPAQGTVNFTHSRNLDNSVVNLKVNRDIPFTWQIECNYQTVSEAIANT